MVDHQSDPPSRIEDETTRGGGVHDAWPGRVAMSHSAGNYVIGLIIPRILYVGGR